jgi:hypothetical protein
MSKESIPSWDKRSFNQSIQTENGDLTASCLVPRVRKFGALLFTFPYVSMAFSDTVLPFYITTLISVARIKKLLSLNSNSKK